MHLKRSRSWTLRFSTSDNWGVPWQVHGTPFFYNMKIHLLLYKSGNLAFPVANTFVNMFVKSGHCGLQVSDKNQTVFIHFFDDGTTITTHDPMRKFVSDSLYIGKTPFTLAYIKQYAQSLQNPGRVIAIWERSLWVLSLGRYKPKHTCVYNTSLILNCLFGLPINHGTPNQMKKMYVLYSSKTRKPHGQ